jgi:hypothetical protein
MNAVAMKKVSAKEMLAETATKLIVKEPVRIPQAPNSIHCQGCEALASSPAEPISESAPAATTSATYTRSAREGAGAGVSSEAWGCV